MYDPTATTAIPTTNRPTDIRDGAGMTRSELDLAELGKSWRDERTRMERAHLDGVKVADRKMTNVLQERLRKLID
jgi:hypothetical protein